MAAEELAAENKRLRAALERTALRRRVRIGSGGVEWPNGILCTLCNAECGPDETLIHGAGCLLGSGSDTGGGDAE